MKPTKKNPTQPNQTPWQKLKTKTTQPLKNLKTTLHQIQHGKIGRRFTNHYNHRKQKQHQPDSLIKSTLITLLALLLITIGITLALVPALPGILLVIPGLAILAARSRLLAKTLDRAEITLRKRLTKNRKPKPTQKQTPTQPNT